MSCSDCISNVPRSVEYFETIREATDTQLLPLSGSMELTLKCNVRCKHCYILYPGATDHEMNTDEVKRMLDIMSDNGVLVLLLTGGEPVTRPDFKEIWAYAKQKGFILSLYSNATLINEDLASFLASHLPRRVEITIYGHTEETYESVTGVRGSYQRFRQGVDFLHRYKVPIAFKTMVMKSNVHEFHDMKKWAEDQGCTFRFDTMINPRINGDREVLKERLDPEQLAAFEATLEGSREFMENYAQDIRRAGTTDSMFSCGAGVKSFHIDPAGQLHPCMLWRKSPYDLRNKPLEEGWRDHVSNLRARKAPKTGCNSCSNRGVCGRCPAASFLEMNDPGKSVPYHCKVGEARRKYHIGSFKPIEIARRHLSNSV